MMPRKIHSYVCIVQGCSLDYSLAKKSIQTYSLQQSCSVGMLGANPGNYSNKSPSLPPTFSPGLHFHLTKRNGRKQVML